MRPLATRNQWENDQTQIEQFIDPRLRHGTLVQGVHLEETDLFSLDVFPGLASFGESKTLIKPDGSCVVLPSNKMSSGEVEFLKTLREWHGGNRPTQSLSRCNRQAFVSVAALASPTLRNSEFAP